MYKAHEIAKVLSSDPRLLSDLDTEIEFITMDTRKVQDPKKTLFFALRGSLHDGHNFVKSAIDMGIKNIVVEKDYQPFQEGINYFPVIDSLRAMQTLAGFHRSSFGSLKVIGITGSNGKTTIKEWLYQLIQGSNIVKSPKSYNSQTGVALSLWQIKERDELGIFEAGISTSGEMVHLAEMINPDIGLFTQIGDAHAEGFASMEEKLEEKLILFKDCPIIIYEEDHILISQMIKARYSDKTLWSWGKSIDATLFRIIDIKRNQYQTEVTIFTKGNSYCVNIPFADSASIHNTMHCIAVMLVLGISMDEISQGINKLHNIPMRLEMKNGIQQSILINDTYNADLQSFKIALEFLSQQSGIKDKVVILSDFKQTGISVDQLNHQLSILIQNHDIKLVVGVGSDIFQLGKYLDPFILFSHFWTTEDLLTGLSNIDIKNKAVLIKGARVFQLEKIVLALSDKAHTAILETDLQAVEHNMKIFSQMLSPKTGIIAVIKASAYGSGSEELARFLEF
ncbi:MAG: UDP-N-acetylmuramoyl-tripeptide--D-alanyl-D-alanine ligase, partial [Saprospiraceae bacterium]